MNIDTTTFFMRTLGGAAYWRRLLDAGMTKDDIKQLLDAHLKERTRVIEFMGGDDSLSAIEPRWREAMVALSALRMIVEAQRI